MTIVGEYPLKKDPAVFAEIKDFAFLYSFVCADHLKSKSIQHMF